MGKGCLGLAIALAVLGCDAERPMTVGEYCRRVSDQLHRCFKEYQEILAAPRPGYPACDAYGRDIEAQFQILVERPMSPEARRVAGYVHMKAIDFVDHVFPHEPGDSEHYTERNTAALSALAAICDGMPDSLE